MNFEFNGFMQRMFGQNEKSIGAQGICSFTLAKYRLASSPDTASTVLHKLAGYKNAEIAQRVAENPHTSDDTLELLAVHECPSVRSTVAENASTPSYILQKLAFDEHVDVRFSLAENHNSPHNILMMLAEDENPYVSSRAQKTMIRLSKQRVATLWIHQNIDQQRRINGTQGI